MTITKYDVRRGAYYDSVVLMQLQRGLIGLPGIRDAGVVMATPANCDLLAANNLLPEAITASPDDLLIVVEAEDEPSATDAIHQVDSLLAKKRSSISQDFRPRSLSSAVKQLPEANWVLVSVPGRYAAGVAREALDLGKHVFLYSDNVSLEDEIALKKTAREKGLLVMGPDCGTAIINGIGLGFANRVRRGPIGLVGASGTGTQAVTVHIHNLGGGISHAIGTGGRDLKSEVGAITAHQALDLLARDEETKVIVLVSKPPSPDVATSLISAAQNVGKPVVVYFIGYPPPARKIGNLHFAISLSEAAELAVNGNWEVVSHTKLPMTNYYLRGLFSGGTLAYETLLGLQASLSPIYSNAPITNYQLLNDPLHSEAHTIIDLGDEFFMVGRLHPMIDNDLRIRRIKQEAADPEVGMILLDVVLGEGSHPDPASELVPVIQEIRHQRAGLEFVTMVIGTEDDPQNLESQIERLKEAGAIVFRTAAEAVEYISLRFNNSTSNKNTAVNLEQLTQPLAAINVGLESFYESLASQGARAVHVEWRPPAGGNERLASLLAKMKK
ncbi:MAG TPA: acyl-CoA synthetase FdrA [Anaerolineales bacterium]|jgi:FdrA protein|nr:acyl-CoA synthetase FdrA [Anaerolineales bacterium]